ncbi:hypothetical protein CPAR01_12847 [Colletotrichum paranaense]|uniref:Zn(2)-C6 fungal-type domain-containing protein n=1 Tax=Colletotrichum paranaense TaxID=1914294 RepID=A0ABQ9S7L0_9PEZI|nr:uncharacterized protein CPAR01_12847 [Colletotrichum paranaense]KAK1528289.1 hypothetical protein CPAR01_12847 [Colletotrichum paranaense]
MTSHDGPEILQIFGFLLSTFVFFRKSSPYWTTTLPNMPSNASSSRTHKSCDACTSRKVRCPGRRPGSSGTCTNCTRRKSECVFGVRKLARRPNIQRQFFPTSRSSGTPDEIQQGCTVSVLDFATLPTPASKSPDPTISEKSSTPDPNARRPAPHRIPELYVDRVLDRARKAPRSTRPSEASNYVKGYGIFGGTKNLTFFSEGRLKSLAQCLGHEKVHDLVGRIASAVEERGRFVKLRACSLNRRPERPACLDDKALLAKYVKLYFEQVHPRFPFLDRDAFERTAFSQDQPHSAPKSKSWICLYHSVLALGCQYDGGGSFEPGEGDAWKFFSIALANFADLIMLPDTLTTFQAVVAMMIYSLGIAGIVLEHVLMSEAARRAQNLADAKFVGAAADAFRRTFWVFYSLEKINSFHHGRSSAIMDCDISCSVPSTPESFFSGGFDWFLCFVSHARLLSRANTSLFSVGVSDNPGEYHLDIIDQLLDELEDWRNSLPDNGFRPGGWVKPHSIIEDQERTVALCALNNMGRYRMMATIPIMAFFVLFDLVIHNPRQIHTATNLALLDVVKGHCSRMEMISNGAIPGSMVGEFAQIARSYVNEVNGRSPTGLTPHAPSEAFQALTTQPQWSLPQQPDYDVASTDIHTDFSTMNLASNSTMTGRMDIEAPAVVPNPLVGTDVMNLFEGWLPDLDPMFFHTMSAQNNMDQSTSQHDFPISSDPLYGHPS